jgi:hypothetical protein
MTTNASEKAGVTDMIFALAGDEADDATDQSGGERRAQVQFS